MTSQRGYTLVELLVSAAIMLTVTGAIFSLMNPAQGSAQVQPEVADLQQRMRVGTEVLFKELIMAGAGTYQGSVTGSLLNYFAPILPRRGGDSPDAKTVFRPDAITLTYIPNTYSQTTIRDPMPPQATPIKVQPQPNCPDQQHNALCGYEEGMEVLIFDSTGTYDTFTITSVADEALQLRHQGQALSKTYETGSQIAQAVRRTFYLLDNQLRMISGHDDVPVVDNVVALTFQYFGDPQPPTAPRPTIGTANCVVDASGNPILPVLAATDGSLAALSPTQLTNGPWCGSGTNEYDADLLRVRKVRVTLRMQVANPVLRGGLAVDGTTQRTGAGGERYVPDYVVSFDVTPRNMNLTR